VKKEGKLKVLMADKKQTENSTKGKGNKEGRKERDSKHERKEEGNKEEKYSI
jgi:hypothetical protein